MTKVSPRIHERHPEIEDADVTWAWEHYILLAVRVPGESEVRLGFDLKARELEMVGVLEDDGDWFVYHAMTPPTEKFLREADPKGRR